jgi:cell filamentation protein
MYDLENDPYCYPGSRVLINIPGIRNREALAEFELAFVTQRFEEGLPGGRLGAAHLRAVHKHLFQDVYSWAGKYRTVRISKGDNMFCYPERIEAQLSILFNRLQKQSNLRGLSRMDFTKSAAKVLSDLNAVHPFRDGNGRTQLAFLIILAFRAGHELDLNNLWPEQFLNAMISSFHGEEQPLIDQLSELISH